MSHAVVDCAEDQTAAEKDVPAADLAEAARFLGLLDPSASFFTFQKYPDHDGCTERAGVLHGSLEECAPLLLEANRNGCGIAVTVNETDGKGRTTANIVRVRAVFIDGDGLSLAELEGISPKPHIVTQSSPGHYHAYWLVQDCSPELFKQMQEALAVRFGCPDVPKDLPHAMRMPGFLHQKDPEQPHLVRIVGGE